MKKIILGTCLVVLLSLTSGFIYFKFFRGNDSEKLPDNPKNIASIPAHVETESGQSTTESSPLPTVSAVKILENDYHIFQTFNNCGPASLSMALSYYGISVSQKTIGDELRPYQITSGDNDDKSVSLAELAKKGKDFGLIPYHRPGGNPEIVKKFISLNIPVITRTWTKPDEDIGHYRVIKGYDDTKDELIQDDSLQGKNLSYDYDTFGTIWEKFSYEFLVLIPPEKDAQAKAILGDLVNENSAWQKAEKNARDLLNKNPNDPNQRLNLSVALYYLGDYQNSVTEFEKARSGLPKRALWYQIEPILAYYKLGRYDRVFEISENILNGGNRAFSELYFLRGKIYELQGKNDLAQEEFNKAQIYNKNLTREEFEELAAI